MVNVTLFTYRRSLIEKYIDIDVTARLKGSQTIVDHYGDGLEIYDKYHKLLFEFSFDDIGLIDKMITALNSIKQNLLELQLYDIGTEYMDELLGSFIERELENNPPDISTLVRIAFDMAKNMGYKDCSRYAPADMPRITCCNDKECIDITIMKHKK
ncbi:MAG: hypothetical protein GXO43_06935 [Crenarchaeota archaeon]|nr:hypothetical protein [Thermoproteota archaeon]